MTKIFTPSAGPGDWKGLLADPEKHWVRGRSARTLAHSWEDSSGFPPEVAKVLEQCTELRGVLPLLIFPEWKVPLPGGRRASQNDVWVLAKCSAGLVSIAVEGKVEEPFGHTLIEWQKDASPGKKERLSYLAETLGLTEQIPGHIYYQLLHRSASAVIEAERFNASHAVMLVHTFSPSNQWFPEYREFVALFGVDATVGILATVSAKGGMPLHLGWVHGDERYLNV
ncbi:MAG: hypothetical protein J3T61_03785 [Candidatus Brocadiales bacterium]|nr:hypothetical protein [Candidatus Bathyanammoxibius sp.]